MMRHIPNENNATLFDSFLSLKYRCCANVEVLVIKHLSELLQQFWITYFPLSVDIMIPLCIKPKRILIR